MEWFLLLHPVIRVGHYFQFPIERNPAEQGRIGYCYAFHLVDGGRGTVTCRDQTYPLGKGDLVYIPPGVRHGFFTTRESPLSTYNLYVDLWPTHSRRTERHLEWNDKECDPAFQTPMLACPPLDAWPVVQPLQHATSQIEWFALATKQHETGSLFSKGMADCLFKAFLLGMWQTNPEARPTDYRIKSIIERLDRDACRYADYDQWLEDCGLRKSHFNQLFREATGVSPKAYWTKSVMRQAEIALQESNSPITEIADRLGYSSIHHFTKQFTRFHGVSPLEYRRRRT